MAELDQTTVTEPRQFTAADVAKYVNRQVVEVVIDPKTKKPKLDEEKRPVTKITDIAVKAEEVLDFAIRGSEVTVVTTDGQKLTGNLPVQAA